MLNLGLIAGVLPCREVVDACVASDRVALRSLAVVSGNHRGRDDAADSLDLPTRPVQEVVDDPAIDAVIVTGAPLAQRDLAQASLAAGKHVFLTDPIAASVDDAVVLGALASEEGPRLMPSAPLRFESRHQRVHAMLADEAVGQVGIARLTFAADPTETTGESFFTGSVLRHVDLLQWWFGSVRRVFARGLPGAPGYVQAILRHVGGEISYLEVSHRHLSARATLEVAGSTGLIQHDSADTVSLVIETVDADSEGPIRSTGNPQAVPARTLEIEHFAECVATGSPFICTVDDAVEQLRIVAAIQESFADRQPVQLHRG